MQDKQGRTYARLSELKEGDKIKVDGDFPCMEPWSEHTVHYHGEDILALRSRLYIDCKHGKHFLDGQLIDNKSDYLNGIYKID